MRIAVEPCFNEAHFMEAHINNICEYLRPDLFVIAEGMFPRGPENSLTNTETFKRKWTKDGVRSRDFDQLEAIVDKASDRWLKTRIQLVKMDYAPTAHTAQVYYEVFTSFLKFVKPTKDDVIFTLESDLFFTKDQAEKFLEVCSNTSPGQGFNASYRMFFESPMVCMAHAGRSRRVMFRWGDGAMYDKIAREYFTESYNKVLPTAQLDLFHYEWVRPDWYFDLRLAQLPEGPADRPVGVHQAIRQMRDLIRSKPQDLQAEFDRSWNKYFALKTVPLAIADHPKHILTHPNFVYYYGGER